mgnify:CR=1 FL=1
MKNIRLKKELQDKIKVREDVNKKWGSVYSQQEILNLKQELIKVSNKEVA